MVADALCATCQMRLRMSEDPYGPPPGDKIISVTVDVFKVWRLLQRWARRKEEAKRCGKLTTTNLKPKE